MALNSDTAVDAEGQEPPGEQPQHTGGDPPSDYAVQSLSEGFDWHVTVADIALTDAHPDSFLKNPVMLRSGSMCSGFGCWEWVLKFLTVGVKEASDGEVALNFENVYMCDNDPACQEVLPFHAGDKTLLLKDILKLLPEDSYACTCKHCVCLCVCVSACVSVCLCRIVAACIV